jgi:hypothetical protein
MRASVIVSLVAVTGATAVAALSGPATASSSSCVNLKVTADVKPALRLAYFTLHGSKHRAVLQPGSTFYGRCGATYWAAGTFNDVGRAETNDQPETFRRLPGHVWHDRGDDGALCSVPLSLRKKWNMGVQGPC